MAIYAYKDGFAVVAGFTHFRRERGKDTLHIAPHKVGAVAGYVRTLAPTDTTFSRFLVRREHRASFTPGPMLIWSVADASIAPLEGEAIEDAVLSAKGHLVVLARGAAKADELLLFEARVAGTRVELVRRIELPSPKKVPVGKRPFAEDRARDEDDDEDDDDAPPISLRAMGGRTHLSTSPYGVAVGSTLRGVVAVLDPATLAPRLSVRVPSHPEQFDVFALAAPGGALVALVDNYRASELAFVNDAGKLEATLSKVGSRALGGVAHAGVILNETTALVGDGDEGLLRVTLPSLKVKAVDGADGPTAMSGLPEGRAAIVAFGELRSEKPEGWRYVRYEATAKAMKESEIDLAQVLAPPVRLVKAEAPGGEAIKGPPALAAAATGTWAVKVDGEAELSLNVTNLGGACRALDVIAGGPAFDGGLVTLVTQSVAVEIPAGVITHDSKRPTAPCAPVPLAIRVRGKKPGSALLTLRVRPSNPKVEGGGGSALCGRPVTVS